MGQYCSCTKGQNKKVRKYKSKSAPLDYHKERAEWNKEAFEGNSITNGNHKNYANFHNDQGDFKSYTKYNTLDSYASHHQSSNYLINNNTINNYPGINTNSYLSDNNNNSRNYLYNDKINYLSSNHPKNKSFTHSPYHQHEDRSQNSLSYAPSLILDHSYSHTSESIDDHLSSSILTDNNTYAESDIQSYSQKNSQRVVGLLEKVLDYLVDEVDTYYLHLYACKVRGNSELFCSAKSQKDEVRMVLWDILTGQEGDDFGCFCELLSDEEHNKQIVELLMSLECIVSLVSTLPHISQLSCAHRSTFSMLEQSYFTIELVTPQLNTISQFSTISSSMSLCSLDSKRLNGSTMAFMKNRVVPRIALTLFKFCFCSELQEGRLVQLISQFKTLTEINLLSCNFNEQSSLSFVQALTHNKSIEKLNLTSSPLHHCSFDSFIEALGSMKSTLRSFSCTYTNLHHSKLQSLITTLSSKAYLNELDLSFNQIPNSLSQTLADVLESSSSLKVLKIKNTQLTMHSFKPICASLTNNSTLQALDLSGNDIQDSGIEILSKAMIHNSSLRKINLEKCGFSSIGSRSLARTLKANYSLREVNLSSNSLCDQGMVVLSESLCYNQSLRVLEMGNCKIGNEGFHHLLKSLKHNRRIRVIKLCYNYIGKISGASNGGDGGDDASNGGGDGGDDGNGDGSNGGNGDDGNGDGNSNNDEVKDCNGYSNFKDESSNINNNNNNNNTSICTETLFNLMKEVLHLNPHLKLYLRGNLLSEYLNF